MDGGIVQNQNNRPVIRQKGQEIRKKITEGLGVFLLGEHSNDFIRAPVVGTEAVQPLLLAGGGNAFLFPFAHPAAHQITKETYGSFVHKE